MRTLTEACHRFSAELHAYCFMPDHVRVLVSVPEGIPLTALVRDFKQRSGYELKRVTGDFAWQVSYYDHILRKEESIVDMAMYIWDNPVKAGVAGSWLDYPYSGPRDRLTDFLG
jgi:REP element-mobilizing transposase RayT